jgi:hypothetical protein
MIRSKPWDLAIDVGEVASILVAICGKLGLFAEHAGVVRWAYERVQRDGVNGAFWRSCCEVVDGVRRQGSTFTGRRADDLGDLSNVATCILVHVLLLGEHIFVVGWFLLASARLQYLSAPTSARESDRRLRAIDQRGVVLILANEVFNPRHGYTAHALQLQASILEVAAQCLRHECEIRAAEILDRGCADCGTRDGHGGPYNRMLRIRKYILVSKESAGTLSSESKL